MTKTRAESSPHLRAARALCDEGKVDDARELLLERGYIHASDPAIHAAYSSLIPAPDSLNEWIEGPFADANSPDSAVRFKALDKIAKTVAKAWSKLTLQWARDPRTIDVLLAHTHDSDPRITEAVATALGAIAVRYFADQRIAAAAVSLLDHPSSRARVWAVHALRTVGGESHVVRLDGLVRDEDVRVRQELAIVLKLRAEAITSPDAKHALAKAVVPLLSDNDATVRGQIATVLSKLDAREFLPALKAAKAKEKEKVTRGEMNEAIKSLST